MIQTGKVVRSPLSEFLSFGINKSFPRGLTYAWNVLPQPLPLRLVQLMLAQDGMVTISQRHENPFVRLL